MVRYVAFARARPRARFHVTVTSVSVAYALRVEVVSLKRLDPDDFIRHHQELINEYHKTIVNVTLKLNETSDSSEAIAVEFELSETEVDEIGNFTINVKYSLTFTITFYSLMS